MGVFTITTSSSGNQGPTARNLNMTFANRHSGVLSSSSFAAGYSDPENDTFSHIKLTSVPSQKGAVLFNGTDVQLGQEISITDIGNGLFTVVGPDTDSSSIFSMDFKVHDGTGFSENTASLNIVFQRKKIEVNRPPTVGNHTITLEYNTEKDFTPADFTADYYDPEGDSPKDIKIVSISGKGKIYLLGQHVNWGQVIPMAEISGLTYVPDESVIDEYTDVLTFQIEDSGSGQFSNEAKLNITVKELDIDAPAVDDNIGILLDKTYVFSSADFTKNFQATHPYYYDEVRIESLPTVGGLEYLGKEVKPEFSFSAGNTNGLVYTLPDNYAAYNGNLYNFEPSVTGIISDHEAQGYNLTENKSGIMTFTNSKGGTVTYRGRLVDASWAFDFDFSVTDDSPRNMRSNVAEFTFTPEGNINVVEPNSPPSIGDGNKQVEYGKPVVLTRADFTTRTNPPYNDPDGDAPLMLKIVELPSGGILKLGKGTVTKGQEIPFTDIDDEKLTFEPDLNHTTEHDETFEFTISDTGSRNYSI